MTLPDFPVERLAREFVGRTLPKARWTHEAHLCVGLWHVLRYPTAVALDLLRLRIRAYNESVGGSNTATGGYHETITKFYVTIIRRFLDSVDARRPIEELAAELTARWGDRELPFSHYSRERLMAVDARLGWVEPDLKPLGDP